MALKQAFNETARQSLARELTVTEGLRCPVNGNPHPNVVQIFGYTGPITAPDSILMELCDGDLFDECYNADNPILLHQWLTVVWQLLDVAHMASTHNICHLDLKPANIMITRNLDGGFHTKVADWGMAAQLHDTAALMGTPTFMPPEVRFPQFLGQGFQVTNKIDVFSIGRIALEMVLSTSVWCAFGCNELELFSETVQGQLLQSLLRKGLFFHPHDRLMLDFIDWLIQPDPALRPAAIDAIRWLKEFTCTDADGKMTWKAKYMVEGSLCPNLKLGVAVPHEMPPSPAVEQPPAKASEAAQVAIDVAKDALPSTDVPPRSPSIGARAHRAQQQGMFMDEPFQNASNAMHGSHLHGANAPESNQPVQRYPTPPLVRELFAAAQKMTEQQHVVDIPHSNVLGERQAAAYPASGMHQEARRQLAQPAAAHVGDEHLQVVHGILAAKENKNEWRVPRNERRRRRGGRSRGHRGGHRGGQAAAAVLPGRGNAFQVLCA